MDPITFRDFAPRLVIGLLIAAVAAAGVFTLNRLDHRTDGGPERFVSLAE
jgi:hypothetical protein